MRDKEEMSSQPSKLPVSVRPQLSAARNLKRRSISMLNGTQNKITRTSTPLNTGRTGLATRPASVARQMPSTARQTTTSRFPAQPITGRATIAPGTISNRSFGINRPTNTTITKRASSPTATKPSRESVLQKEVEELKQALNGANNQIQLLSATVDMKEQTLNMKNEMLDASKMQADTFKMQLEALQAKMECKIMEVDNLQTKLTSTNEELEKQSAKLIDSQSQRRELDLQMRKLLNDVVDLKGQIRVAIRTRPLLEKENEPDCQHLSYPSPTSIVLDMGGANKAQTFDFQKVFGPNFTQKRIFDDVQELVLSVLHGYNVSIIAFGQTGSGKTYTMRGEMDAENMGIIPRAAQCVFENRDQMTDLGWEFELSTSYVEVYNEEVHDLLAGRKKLNIKIGSGTAVVEGLTRRTVNSWSEIENVLMTADRSRTTAATKCNETSSRSHAIFELKVYAKNRILGSECTSALHLVDLAGSERVKDSGAEGDRFKELTNINQGLTNLNLCIRSQMNKCSHVPYRNSKLTMMLMNSLGAGSSKTLVIVTLNPALAQASETKRSLEFAKEMSTTKIGAAVRQEK